MHTQHQRPVSCSAGRPRCGPLAAVASVPGMFARAAASSSRALTLMRACDRALFAQPYTRNGLRKDADDGRASSFASLLAALPRMAHPPTRLLLENVVGFDTSRTREEVLSVLAAASFVTHEFVLSPTQLGVPYSRPRYFLLAARAPGARCALARPLPAVPWPHPPPEVGGAAGEVKPPEAATPCAPLSAYYDAEFSTEVHDGSSSAAAASGWREYAVPWSAVRRAMRAVDLVDGDATRCCCFTKSYGKFAKGTGSLILRTRADIPALFAAVEPSAEVGAEPLEAPCEDEQDDAPSEAPELDAWPDGAPPLRYGFVWVATLARAHSRILSRPSQLLHAFRGGAAARLPCVFFLPTARDAAAALRAARQLALRRRRCAATSPPAFGPVSVGGVYTHTHTLAMRRAPHCPASSAMAAMSSCCSMACMAATASPMSPAMKAFRLKLTPLRWSLTRLSL